MTNGWLAHDDDNKVDVLYAARWDTPKQEVKVLAKYIRQGLTIRRIIHDDARYAWGKTLSEAEMRKIAAPPEYDPEDGSALRIAERLVDMNRVPEAV